jgi:hypothetical protein
VSHGCYLNATCENTLELARFFEWLLFSDVVKKQANDLGYVRIPDVLRDVVFAQFTADMRCATTGKLVLHDNSTSIQVDAQFTSDLFKISPLLDASFQVLGLDDQSRLSETENLALEFTSHNVSSLAALQMADSGLPHFMFAISDYGDELTHQERRLVDHKLMEVSAFAAPVSVLFNLCGSEAALPCHGSINAKVLYEELGTLVLSPNTLVDLMDGSISTWAQLGARINNTRLQSIPDAIILLTEFITSEMSLKIVREVQKLVGNRTVRWSRNAHLYEDMDQVTMLLAWTRVFVFVPGVARFFMLWRAN